MLWVVLISIQIFIQLLGYNWWPLVGRGRLFTRPLWPYWFFKPISPWGTFAPVRTRLAQMLVIVAGLVVEVPIDLIWGFHPFMQDIIPTSVIVLYLDDFLTGDDERWQRFKNKLKRLRNWRLRILTPAPSRA